MTASPQGQMMSWRLAQLDQLQTHALSTYNREPLYTKIFIGLFVPSDDANAKSRSYIFFFRKWKTVYFRFCMCTHSVLSHNFSDIVDDSGTQEMQNLHYMIETIMKFLSIENK